MESNSIPSQFREQEVKKAEKASQWANLEGYAQKLLQGFDKLDERAALKAPWELMQNACDQTKESPCIVTVDFQHDKLAFSHNGQPFSTTTLLALIKQKSGEKRAGQELAMEEGKPPIGQYGTGFITTHSFGRVIQLDSTLLIGEPGAVEAIPLTNFQLDRSTESEDEAGKLEELTNKLFAQEKEMYRLILGAEPLPEPGTTTTFCYKPASDTERHKIQLALASLRLYTPYVMALNNTLHEVTLVEATEEQTHYAKGAWVEQADYWQMPVAVGGHPITLSCLRSADDSIVVVLPLTDGEVAVEPDPELARLFLYFPLIGTACWGCNFLIHAKQFAPTEPRDGLQLDLAIESAKQKAEQNRTLLLEASEMIFNFLENAAERIAHPIHLARINFGPWPVSEEDATQHFPRLLQQRWVEQFRELQLVETPTGRQSVAACWFLDPELLQDETARPAIHAVAAQLWGQQLPTEELITAWTDVLREWQDEAVNWITAENLAEWLAAHGSLDGLDAEALRKTYAYLLAQGKSQLFDDYALLPVGSGEFWVRNVVKLPVNLAAGHLTALRGIAPEIVAEFIAPGFAGLGIDLALESYGRSKLERDVNEKTKKLRDDGSAADELVLAGLLALNSIFPGELKGGIPSTRRKLLPLVGRFYVQILPEEIVPIIKGDEIDHESTPFRTLLKVFLGDVARKYSANEEWAAGALPLLLECLDVLASVAQVQDDVKAAVIFPNQQELPRLCKPVGMLVEQDFGPAGGDAEQDATRLKDIYERVTGTDIREKLVHPDFERVLSYFKPETMTGRELSAKIESQLMAQALDDITGHSKKAEIFTIVRLLADYPDTKWSSFFPNINEKRASIVLAKVQNPKVKDDLFNIISLDDDYKIEQLGKLAQDKNFDEIINLGRKALNDAAKKSSDFEFKREIGVMIEDLIRDQIQKEVAGLPVQVKEEQGGQDMVIQLAGKTVYYLEVKSRWQVGYSTTLSHLQSIRAAENPDCYALCCVDLTTYFPTGEAKRHVITAVEQIENLIRFLPDIGSRVDTLTADVRVAEQLPEAVKLAEKFQVLVPQAVVMQGVGLSVFVEMLRGRLAELAAMVEVSSLLLASVAPTPDQA